MSSFNWPTTSGSSPYWGNSVATSGSLPLTGTTGEVIFVRDTEDMYYWNGSAWTRVRYSLTTDVTGVLPVANGGTNSSTALSNNRVIRSTAGAIVEAAAITANRALVSDANGIPTHTAVTNTELGYVSGVTSAIQTQLTTGATNLTNHEADTSTHGVGEIVGRTEAQTLTNKTLTSPVINTPTGIVKGDVGLGNVDNTSDATKNAASVTLTNKAIDADANTITNIENADIKAAAAIDATKIADGSVTNTEFQYINTLSSNAQTQISAKQANVITTQGDLVLGNGSNAADRLAIGANGTVLTSNGTTASWQAPGTGSYSAKSADYVVLDGDGFRTIGMTTGAANKTITLPTASANTNRVISFVKLDTAAGALIIDGENSETINDATTVTLPGYLDSIDIICDGTNWKIISDNRRPFKYIEGTTYNAVSLVVTSTNWVTTRGWFTPYQCSNGDWHLKFVVTGNFSSGTNSAFTLNFAGVTFKATSSYHQAVSVYDGRGAARTCTAAAEQNTDNINVLLSSSLALDNTWSVSGDVELNSKPTWAY